MPTHDGQYGGSRGSDPGSIPAVVPQDWNFSRRVGFFHMVAPDGGERRPDATAQEESARGSARGEHGDGRRVSTERARRRRPEISWISRPDAAAALDCGSASGLPNDLFTA